MVKIKVFIALLFLMIAVLFVSLNQKKIPEVTITEEPKAVVESKKEPEVRTEKHTCPSCLKKLDSKAVKPVEIFIQIPAQTPVPAQQSAPVVMPTPQPVQQPIIIVQPQQPLPTEPTPMTQTPQHVPETRYTLTLPSGSPVAQPRDKMTLAELQSFAANLFKPHDSPYSKLLVATEAELEDFLKSNGYTILKESI